MATITIAQPIDETTLAALAYFKTLIDALSSDSIEMTSLGTESMDLASTIVNALSAGRVPDKADVERIAEFVQRFEDWAQAGTQMSSIAAATDLLLGRSLREPNGDICDASTASANAVSEGIYDEANPSEEAQ